MDQKSPEPVGAPNSDVSDKSEPSRKLAHKIFKQYPTLVLESIRQRLEDKGKNTALTKEEQDLYAHIHQRYDNEVAESSAATQYRSGDLEFRPISPGAESVSSEATMVFEDLQQLTPEASIIEEDVDNDKNVQKAAAAASEGNSQTPQTLDPRVITEFQRHLEDMERQFQWPGARMTEHQQHTDQVHERAEAGTTRLQRSLEHMLQRYEWFESRMQRVQGRASTRGLGHHHERERTPAWGGPLVDHLLAELAQMRRDLQRVRHERRAAQLQLREAQQENKRVRAKSRRISQNAGGASQQGRGARTQGGRSPGRNNNGGTGIEWSAFGPGWGRWGWDSGWGQG
ncbi:hypothetical protein NA57DRAFT_59427 [Rhizodiscina lignyota]|uniref:Uncharacterized protein n=1 Tax=Rhizodiscina lignyota TaxID=1504668 RepID=A0A9P4I9Y4_9PEZI|nr:hypothetical protein NA57DRAFT_59427 [Rhizodiscina lignyota]